MIDARSSWPLVKEDDADREKRRTSAEKHKTALDAEKEKEKKKNIDWQTLEQRWTLARHEGWPKEDWPDKDDDDEDDDDDSEGMAVRLNQLVQPPPQAGTLSTHVEAPKEP